MKESIRTFVTHYSGLRTGDKEWEERLNMIDRAEEHLYISTYYLGYDNYAVEFIDALLRARARDVDVRLAYDTFAQRLAMTGRDPDVCLNLGEHLDALTLAGVKVTKWKPSRLPARLLGGGNHIKVQLSEKGAAIFGSSNICGRSMNLWTEYSGILRGPIVDQLRYWFLHATGALNEVPPLDATPVENAMAVDFHWCDPWRNQPVTWPLRVKHSRITLLLRDQIDKAQKELLIASFHFKPPGILADAVLRALKRGVRVVVVHSGVDALWESEWPWLSAAATYSLFLRAGIELYEIQGGAHSKIMCVDDRWATFGSYNFECAADDRLAEAMISSEDPKLVAELIDVMQETLKHPACRRVNASDWAKRRPGKRIRHSVAWFLRRWL